MNEGLIELIDKLECRYEEADEEIIAWYKREVIARLSGHLKRARYYQRKKIYSEGYADGLFMACYILKLWTNLESSDE